MKIFVVVLLVCLAFTSAETLFDDEDLSLGDNELPLDNGYMSTDADDDNDVIELPATGGDSDVSDDTDVDTDVDTDIITDDMYEQLEGCSRGRCSFCIRVWKIRACVVARLSGSRISLSFTFNGRTIYSRSIYGRRSYTFNISTRKFGVFRYILKEFKIKLSGVDVSRKRFCVTVYVKVRLGWRTKRYSYGPKCIHL